MDCASVKVVHCDVSFNLEHPGFASAPGVQVRIFRLCLLPPSAASSPPTPSSGETARRLCPRCHGMMSSVDLDKHSLCCKCRGADCNLENRCDECMSWSMEETILCKAV